MRYIYIYLLKCHAMAYEELVIYQPLRFHNQQLKKRQEKKRINKIIFSKLYQTVNSYHSENLLFSD
jgi:hypothetical protein